MKRSPLFTLLLLTALPLSFAPLAHAQSIGQVMGQALNQFLDPQTEAASQEQLRSFDHFLRDHPDCARDLRENPNRVNDRGFLDHHPALADWLNDHPNAASLFRQNPQQFMVEERHFQTYNQDFQSGDTHRGELAHFDWFLDSHPKIREDLMRRPELADRDGYLDDHPELRAFLERHPEVRTELRDNPREFMDREARLASQDHDDRQPPENR